MLACGLGALAQRCILIVGSRSQGPMCFLPRTAGDLFALPLGKECHGVPGVALVASRLFSPYEHACCSITGCFGENSASKVS